MDTKELFTDADLARLKRNQSRALSAAIILGVGALAVCVLLCVFTNTANAGQMERAVLVLSALAGWIVIYLIRFPLRQTRAAIEHAQMLRQSERVKITGPVRVTGERRRIRNSIDFRLVECGDAGRPLKVIENTAAALSEAQERIKAVYVANGYIAAWEETP